MFIRGVQQYMQTGRISEVKNRSFEIMEPQEKKTYTIEWRKKWTEIKKVMEHHQAIYALWEFQKVKRERKEKGAKRLFESFPNLGKTMDLQVQES